MKVLTLKLNSKEVKQKQKKTFTVNDIAVLIRENFDSRRPDKSTIDYTITFSANRYIKNDETDLLFDALKDHVKNGQ